MTFNNKWLILLAEKSEYPRKLPYPPCTIPKAASTSRMYLLPINIWQIPVYNLSWRILKDITYEPSTFNRIQINFLFLCKRGNYDSVVFLCKRGNYDSVVFLCKRGNYDSVVPFYYDNLKYLIDKNTWNILHPISSLQTKDIWFRVSMQSVLGVHL
jgi:hypothetical protein